MTIRVLAVLIGLALAGVAQAQIKCWTDAKGKRSCGDVPPPGARIETPKGAPAPQAPPASQEREIRRSQPESQKPAAKLRLEKSPPSGNPQECERAKELLAKMGGGGRSKRTDAVRARALYQNNCPP